MFRSHRQARAIRAAQEAAAERSRRNVQAAAFRAANRTDSALVDLVAGIPSTTVQTPADPWGWSR